MRNESNYPKTVRTRESNVIAFGVRQESDKLYILWSYYDGFYLATDLTTMKIETLSHDFLASYVVNWNVDE